MQSRQKFALSACILLLVGAVACASVVAPTPPADSDCEVTSIQKLPTTYENYSFLFGSTFKVTSKQDSNGIYQVYTIDGDRPPICISCTRAARRSPKDDGWPAPFGPMDLRRRRRRRA